MKRLKQVIVRDFETNEAINTYLLGLGLVIGDQLVQELVSKGEVRLKPARADIPKMTSRTFFQLEDVGTTTEVR